MCHDDNIDIYDDNNCSLSEPLPACQYYDFPYAVSSQRSLSPRSIFAKFSITEYIVFSSTERDFPLYLIDDNIQEQTFLMAAFMTSPLPTAKPALK